MTDDMRLRMSVRYTPLIAGGSSKHSKTENYPLSVHIYMSHELLPDVPVVVDFLEPRRSTRTGLPRTQLAFDVDVPMRFPTRIENVFAPMRDAGAYTFASVGRLFQLGKISRSVHLVFNAFATTRTDEGDNQLGAVAKSRVGTASMSVDIVTSLLSYVPDKRVSVVLVQNTNNVILAPGGHFSGRGLHHHKPLRKGRIEIRSLSIVDKTGVSLFGNVRQRQLTYWNQLQLPNQIFDLASDKERETAAIMMRNIVLRSLRAFNDPGGTAFLPTPTLPFMARFHCPEERLADSFVPSLAYLANKPRRTSNKNFYLAALANVIRRQSLDAFSLNEATLSLLAHGIHSAAHHAVLGVMVRTLSLLTTSMPYLDDFTNANVAGRPYKEGLVSESEDMKISRITGADDCEGDGLESVMEAVEMAGSVRFDASLPRASSNAPSSAYLEPLAANLQRLLRLYVPCTSLMVVTNKKLTYGAARMHSNDALAHTVCILIPFQRFERWLSDNAANAVREHTIFYDSRRDEIMMANERMREAHTSLPVLVCEGTSRMNPAMLPLSRYYTSFDRTTHDDASSVFEVATRALHASCIAADAVQNVIDRTLLTLEVFCPDVDDTRLVMSRTNTDLHNFYKHVISCQTMAFAGVRVMDFTFVYPHGPNRDSTRTYGVTFNDFLMPENQDKIALVPHLQLEQVEAAMIDMVIGADEPVPALTNDLYSNRSNRRAKLKLDDENRLLPVFRTRLNALVRYDREEHKRRRIAGEKVTVLNARKLVVSARVQDIGLPELHALEASAQLRKDDGTLMFFRISIYVFSVTDAVVEGDLPMHIIDVSFSF